jgi:hypothetical protein
VCSDEARMGTGPRYRDEPRTLTEKRHVYEWAAPCIIVAFSTSYGAHYEERLRKVTEVLSTPVPVAKRDRVRAGFGWCGLCLLWACHTEAPGPTPVDAAPGPPPSSTVSAGSPGSAQPTGDGAPQASADSESLSANDIRTLQGMLDHAARERAIRDRDRALIEAADAGMAALLATMDAGRASGPLFPLNVHEGAVDVKGPLPREAIHRAVQPLFEGNGFRLCYLPSLELTPGIGGRVDLHFTIDSSGSVGGMMVLPSTTFPDAAMNACVADELGKLSFPPPRSGSVDVVYRLTFAAN